MKAYRRMLALGAVSLLLHVLTLAWITRQAAPTSGATRDAPPRQLALRLQPAPGRPIPVEPARTTSASAAAPRPGRAVPPSMPPSASAALPASPAPLRDVAATAAPGQDVLQQMPGTYQSRMPPSAVLTYTLLSSGAAPAVASMRWQTDGHAYALHSEGVTGTLASQGGASDAGIAPHSFSEQRGDGGTTGGTFAGEEIDIDGRTYPNSAGSQDRLSLLLQLTGMGLADPDQVSDVIDIYVAGARAPEIMRFQVVEEEELATPLGTMATRHLVQLVRAGEARLEIWLAPARGWLPVQLRLTAPDGAVSTQTVTRIDDAGQ